VAATPVATTITVTYSSVVTYTNFDGVVTFSNGTFSSGGTSINGTTAATTIDGGNITTGTIGADKLTVGEENRTASRLLLLENSLKIFEGNTLRVHLGDLSNTDT
jgi:hypothetical protein